MSSILLQLNCVWLVTQKKTKQNDRLANIVLLFVFGWQWISNEWWIQFDYSNQFDSIWYDQTYVMNFISFHCVCSEIDARAKQMYGQLDLVSLD